MGFGGFSWKRALGISKAKASIARATGIPTSRSGRKAKFGPFGLWLWGSRSRRREDDVEASFGETLLGCLFMLVVAPIAAIAMCAGAGAFIGRETKQPTPLASSPISQPISVAEIETLKTISPTIVEPKTTTRGYLGLIVRLEQPPEWKGTDLLDSLFLEIFPELRLGT